MTATIESSVRGCARVVSGEAAAGMTHRELELGAIIDAYNQVTEKLKASHEVLTSEVRRLRRQLDEKNRELERKERLAALGEMAAGVAHEVRNPLGGILLYATMLEKDLQTLPEPRRVAERIASAARGLEAIVGDILAFANPQKPQCRPTPIAALVRETIELLQPRGAKYGCAVHYADDDAELCVQVEPTQVMRALLNVVSNAIDAAGDGGNVWITSDSIDEDEGLIEVRVADDGPGVPDGLLDRIFNPFFTTKDSGTGLGLAIVHRVVEAHGGRVSVKQREGGGAVFSLTLPR
jgi:signal transduction histidine kinase